ncbi:MAG: alpha-amylase family glycosyl hydrolase [Bacteroidales bacterium]
MKNTFYLIIALLLTFSACTTKHGNHFPSQSQIPGLATLVKLSGSQSVLNLQDYFIDPSLIDSVSGDDAFSFHLDKEKSELVITAQTDAIPILSEMKVWVEGYKYSLLLEKSSKEKFTFVFNPRNSVYKTVFLIGQMNNWDRNSTPLTFKDGVWQTELELNPGRYQYQLSLDGKEIPDPFNDALVDNNIGGFNSLLTVGNIEFKDTPRLYTLSAEDDKIKVGLKNCPEKIYIFWQNHRLPVRYIIRKNRRLTITIPKEAENFERSYIRLWSYNNNGVSNDLLIPLHRREVLTDAAQLGREDYEASILYFLMVDRFNNGNHDNDKPVIDPEVLPPANYKGGDLAGITQKLKDGYFTDLGVNAIWLSPVTQNPYEAYVEYPEPKRKYSGYHGYWPITLTTVDSRYGTSAEMHEMVKEAHNRGINVLLDYVSHHVHEKNPLIQNHPDWTTPLLLPDGSKNIRLWDDQRLTTWFDTFLPTLDFTKPVVAETLADSATFWIKEYDLDGFRHDATKHIPEQYWRTLTRKLKTEVILPKGKRLYQIGETFGSRELIGSYVGSGMLDGQFDFNLYFDARSIFAVDNESFIHLNQSLIETFAYYGTNHLMGNITGNHDLPRFISLASGSLRFNEESTEAGWERNIRVKDQTGYNKLSMLTAFIMTIPGVPVIYYGDEIGIPGGGDPDSRRMMYFDGLNSKEKTTKDIASRLCKLRQEQLSLIYGSFHTLKIDNKVWVYARRYFKEITIVVFNKDSESGTVRFDIPEGYEDVVFHKKFGNNLWQSKKTIEIVMPPYSFEILTAEIL